MSAKQDGGPAFPCEGGDMSGLVAHPGMSLRDWFAGQALAGRLANSTLLENLDQSGYPAEKLPAKMAEHAYMFADAMLEARK